MLPTESPRRCSRADPSRAGPRDRSAVAVHLSDDGEAGEVDDRDRSLNCHGRSLRAAERDRMRPTWGTNRPMSWA